jgi:uracil-DNA glycosylase family 4
LTKAVEFQGFKEKWQSCVQCPLSTLRKQVVFGSGNLDAALMLLGEAPGEDEDDGGLPFQGKAGKVLDSLLDMAGLTREHLWITNTCLCRPKAEKKANRAPTAPEIKACTPRLAEEITIVKPQIVVAMGNTPLYLITGKRGITSSRGWLDKPLKVRDWQARVYATLHPASLLYGSTEQIHQKRAALEADWLEIARHYLVIKEKSRQASAEESPEETQGPRTS